MTLNWTKTASGMLLGRAEGVIEVYSITGTVLLKTGRLGIAIPVGGPYENVESAKAAAELDSVVISTL